MIKNYLRNNVGILFVIISLILGVVFSLLSTVPILEFRPAMLLPVLLVFGVGHLFLTLITYWLSFSEDIKDINENRFLRTKTAILIFATALVILLLTLFDPYIRKSVFESSMFLILSYITLSFSSITFSAFISIIIWRRNLHINVWRVDTFLILIAAFFLGIPSLAFFWILMLLLRLS